MSNPRCVLCGEGINAVPETSDQWLIKHQCGSTMLGYSLKIYIYNPKFKTKAEAIAAIPERFLMNDSKREGE
jgi:hypothetical protein